MADREKGPPLDDRYKAAADIVSTLPEPAKDGFWQVAQLVAAFATEHQLTPDQLVCGLAVVAAVVVLSDGVDPRDETEVNRIIWLGQDALQVAFALHRIQSGAVEPRPDGSFGIRPDA